jgi:hypothetical protein
MPKEIDYKIFSDSLHHPFYILEDSAGNCLEFSRHNWEDCKLTKNDKDLVKIDAIRYQSRAISLNFAFETALSNILFCINNLRNFEVKGNRQNHGLEVINWEWRISGYWTTNAILIDKGDNDKELAKIKNLKMIINISGSLRISNTVPSELHLLIVTSACLVIKFRHDPLTSKASNTEDCRCEALFDSSNIGSF